jgi:hypothetical protein
VLQPQRDFDRRLQFFLQRFVTIDRAGPDPKPASGDNESRVATYAPSVVKTGINTRRYAFRAEGQPFLQEEFATNPSKDSKDTRIVISDIWQSRGPTALREKAALPLLVLMSTAAIMS